jgi:GNAT superfamily N-acetyltransferase
MTHAPFLITALNAAHDRSRFNSGSSTLDRYLREQATQDRCRRVAACFVALDDDLRIAWYYSLSTTSVPLPDLPAEIQHKLPRYPVVPAVRMGRLAVDVEFQRQGLGSSLLINALRRAAGMEIPAAVLIVDAKDEHAAAFYRHHNFSALGNSSLSLFLPLATIRTR